MGFLAQQILWGALLPALIALVVLVAFNRRLWRGTGVSLHWGTPIALTAGYLFAHWRIVGFPLAFPPADSTEWLFVTGGIAAIWGIIEYRAAKRMLLSDLGRLGLVGAVSWLVLKPLIGNLWQGSTGYFWWVGLTLGWWLWWSLQARLADRLPGLLVPLMLSMVAGGGGFVLLWSNSSSLSQLSGAVAAVAGIMVPVQIWRRDVRMEAGGIAPIAGTLGLIWLNAVAFVPVPVVRILMLLVASLTPLLALLPSLKQKSPWFSAILCAVITAGLLASVMLPTYRAYLASAQTDGY